MRSNNIKNKNDQYKELVGKKFGYWTIIKLDEKDHSKVTCLCSCGTIKSVRRDGLLNGTSKSCGCLKLKKWIDRNTKYRNGEISDIRFYRIWQGMNYRCNNSKYLNYHGRGIKVCNKWSSKNKDGYLNFYKDMYPSYIDHSKNFTIKNTTIERVNNDGNYDPDNCKWATRQEQLKNTRRNKKDNV